MRSRNALAVLSAGAALLLNCTSLWAEPDFQIGRLKYSGGGDWYSNPSSLPNLQRALSQLTDMDTARREAVVSLKDGSVHTTPVIYMTGHGNVSFSAQELSVLRGYLKNGGFLWADDNFGMDESFRKQMQLLFPDAPLTKLPASHEIFRSPYTFPKGLPKIHEHHGGAPEAWGIFLEGRMVVFYTYNTDIGDGLEDPDVHSDSPQLRESAMNMAVNIIVYALSN